MLLTQIGIFLVIYIKKQCCQGAGIIGQNLLPNFLQIRQFKRAKRGQLFLQFVFHIQETNFSADNVLSSDLPSIFPKGIFEILY
jgi:hypothetical protein